MRVGRGLVALIGLAVGVLPMLGWTASGWCYSPLSDDAYRVVESGFAGLPLAGVVLLVAAVAFAQLAALAPRAGATAALVTAAATAGTAWHLLGDRPRVVGAVGDGTALWPAVVTLVLLAALLVATAALFGFQRARRAPSAASL